MRRHLLGITSRFALGPTALRAFRAERASRGARFSRFALASTALIALRARRSRASRSSSKLFVVKEISEIPAGSPNKYAHRSINAGACLRPAKHFIDFVAINSYL